MKKFSKVLALVLILILITPAIRVSAATYKAGDIVSFGSYPQTRVTDASLISTLNDQIANTTGWTAYPYYSKNTGTDAAEYPAALNTSMMKYYDFTYNGTKYRAVRITYYRPLYTNYAADTQSQQSNNSIPKNTTLFYKWEPLRWIVLNPSTGLVVSEKILDSQPFCAKYKVFLTNSQSANPIQGDLNSWQYSTMRYWLNSKTGQYNNQYVYFGFQYSAFTTQQRGIILDTPYDNASSDSDKVFLLSKDQFTTYKSYLTSTSVTGYALSQGSNNATRPIWRLKTAGTNAAATRTYYATGENASESDVTYSQCTSTGCGVRPAMRIDLSSSMVTPVTNGPNVYSATISPTSLPVGDKLSATVTTDVDVDYLEVYDEDLKIVYRWGTGNSTVSGDIRTWNVTAQNSSVFPSNVLVTEGTHTLIFIVKKDGKNGWTKSVALTVIASNAASVYSATINPTSLPAGDTLSATVTTDVDVDTLRVYDENGSMLCNWQPNGFSTVNGSVRTWTLSIYDSPSFFPSRVLVTEGTHTLTFKAWKDNRSKTTKSVTLKVIAARPTITKQPVNQTVYAARDAVFSITATGSGTLSYQWQYSSDKSNWTNSHASGYNTNKLTVRGSASVNGLWYRCKVTNSSGPSYSTEAKLTVILNPFKDVSSSAWYYEPVLWAYSNGVTSGTSATTFEPDKTCTRAEFVTFIYKYMGKPWDSSWASECSFPDVKSSDWYYRAAIWAKHEGITNGENGYFVPNKILDRGMAISFLYNMEKYLNGTPTITLTHSKFTDVSKSKYYYTPVLWAEEYHIANGTSSTTFSPEKKCTRAEAVAFLYNIDKYWD